MCLETLKQKEKCTLMTTKTVARTFIYALQLEKSGNVHLFSCFKASMHINRFLLYLFQPLTYFPYNILTWK